MESKKAHLKNYLLFYNLNIYQIDYLAKLIIKEVATSWIVRLPVTSGRTVENEDDFLSREEILQKEHILNEDRRNMNPS